MSDNNNDDSRGTLRFFYGLFCLVAGFLTYYGIDSWLNTDKFLATVFAVWGGLMITVVLAIPLIGTEHFKRLPKDDKRHDHEDHKHDHTNGLSGPDGTY